MIMLVMMVNHDDLSTNLILSDVKDFNIADYTPMAITNDNQLRFINFDYSCTHSSSFYSCIKLDEEKIVDNISGFIKLYENNVEKLSSNFFLQTDNKIVDVPYFLDMQEIVVVGELGDYKKIYHNFKEDYMNTYNLYVVLMFKTCYRRA